MGGIFASIVRCAVHVLGANIVSADNASRIIGCVTVAIMDGGIAFCSVRGSGAVRTALRLPFVANHRAMCAFVTLCVRDVDRVVSDVLASAGRIAAIATVAPPPAGAMCNGCRRCGV